MPRLPVAALALSLAASTHAQQFQIQELPPLPGYTRSFGCGVNEAGTVVGLSDNGGSLGHATRWVDGVPEDLGTLPGWLRGIPFAITSNGRRMVGPARVSDGWVPFIYDDDATPPLQQLPTPDGYNDTRASDINDSGAIIGSAYSETTGVIITCLWSKVSDMYELTILPPLPGDTSSLAYTINGAGVCAGVSISPTAQRAVLWTGGVPALVAGVPASIVSFAADVNDLGHVAGGFFAGPNDSIVTAFHLAPSALVQTGGLPGFPQNSVTTINNTGLMAGNACFTCTSLDGFPEPARVGFIWRAAAGSAGFTRLDNAIPQGLGWVIHQPWGLTDRGLISGMGRLDGQWRALLLTPTCPADVNFDGSHTVQDIFDFLAAYFSAGPAADFNRVGGISVQDIFDFLAAYFTGC